jgi:hypothetical protein
MPISFTILYFVLAGLIILLVFAAVMWLGAQFVRAILGK